MRIATDYLVVGAGASGLAFADALLADGDAELTLIDRRPAPGGHWLDAYEFVRLHSPSAYYGVNSLPLGADRIDEAGEYELWTSPVRKSRTCSPPRCSCSVRMRVRGSREAACAR